MEAEKPEGYDHYKLTVDLMQEKKALLEEIKKLKYDHETTSMCRDNAIAALEKIEKENAELIKANKLLTKKCAEYMMRLAGNPEI